ncbi:MAG: hypothetical protein CM15mP120_02090 [Pseudomonadota bacterium]|nr:MAG: hypothetical protein CM15mP120_02090 [Pseudomonadota bacterium]
MPLERKSIRQTTLCEAGRLRLLYPCSLQHGMVRDSGYACGFNCLSKFFETAQTGRALGMKTQNGFFGHPIQDADDQQMTAKADAIVYEVTLR